MSAATVRVRFVRPAPPDSVPRVYPPGPSTDAVATVRIVYLVRPEASQ